MTNITPGLKQGHARFTCACPTGISLKLCWTHLVRTRHPKLEGVGLCTGERHTTLAIRIIALQHKLKSYEAFDSASDCRACMVTHLGVDVIDVDKLESKYLGTQVAHLYTRCHVVIILVLEESLAFSWGNVCTHHGTDICCCVFALHHGINRPSCAASDPLDVAETK